MREREGKRYEIQRSVENPLKAGSRNTWTVELFRLRSAKFLW